MGNRKVATTVYLTPAQDGQLKELGRRTGLPQAELVRRGVDRILAEHAGILGEASSPAAADRMGLAGRKRQGVA